jgi:hypothetical protein
MSNIEPSGSRLPRSTRERRAYRLVVATGVFGAIAVVGFVLAIAGVGGITFIAFIAAVVAIVSGLLFRRTVRR